MSHDFRRGRSAAPCRVGRSVSAAHSWFIRRNTTHPYRPRHAGPPLVSGEPATSETAGLIAGSVSVSRFHMFHGAVGYLMSPLWFALLLDVGA